VTIHSDERVIAQLQQLQPPPCNFSVGDVRRNCCCTQFVLIAVCGGCQQQPSAFHRPQVPRCRAGTAPASHNLCTKFQSAHGIVRSSRQQRQVCLASACCSRCCSRCWAQLAQGWAVCWWCCSPPWTSGGWVPCRCVMLGGGGWAKREAGRAAHARRPVSCCTTAWRHRTRTTTHVRASNVRAAPASSPHTQPTTGPGSRPHAQHIPHRPAAGGGRGDWLPACAAVLLCWRGLLRSHRHLHPRARCADVCSY
jgi:hypothetical protein